jgi:dCTP deaminase
MLSGIEIQERTKLNAEQSAHNITLFESGINDGYIKPDIVIEPFLPKCVGPNSYDIHLAPEMKVYDVRPNGILGKIPVLRSVFSQPLDSRKQNKTIDIKIPETGFVLKPGILYLASTVEYTETRNLVPKIDGRSSIGRLGILVHFTAGFGDVGFCGTWTLEVAVAQPVRVYPFQRIGQLYFEEISPEHIDYTGHYLGQNGTTASRMENKDNWNDGDDLLLKQRYEMRQIELLKKQREK